MIRQILILALLVGFGFVSYADAGCGRHGCCDPCCVPVCVEKTVMVPTYVKETRMVQCTVYKNETRAKTITVQRCVPEQQERTRVRTVMVPEQRTKTIECNVVKPVWETVTREYKVRVPEWSTVDKEYTVMVPHKVTKQGTRKVAKCVPYTQTKTVTRDKGHWETQCVEVPCCGHRHGCCCRTKLVNKCVWVPNIVTDEVEVTCYKRVVEEVPCEYTVTVCQPETRTRQVKVCNYRTETRTCNVNVCKRVTETQTREVKYTVCVPEKRTHTYMVTVNKYVPEEKTVNYTVCVPETVEKEVEVTVCKMVPKTVTVQTCCRG